MSSLFLLPLCLSQTGAAKTTPRVIKPPEYWQRKAAGPRFSLAYIPLGWKGRSESDRQFAEAQAKIFRDLGERMRLRAVLLRRPANELTRREVLQGLVAIEAGLSLGREPENKLFARADQWRTSFSATEYKWRTLAHWSIQHDLGLTSAYEKHLRWFPDDWRMEVGYIDALLSDPKRQDLSVLRARTLAKRHPKHFGSHGVLARTLSIRAGQTKNRRMYQEALQVLDRARPLITSDFEHAYYAERRAIILQNMKG